MWAKVRTPSISAKPKHSRKAHVTSRLEDGWSDHSVSVDRYLGTQTEYTSETPLVKNPKSKSMVGGHIYKSWHSDQFSAQPSAL
jgi:hypothetical protein